jgi:ATP-independent RNA helicase DbpA
MDAIIALRARLNKLTNNSPKISVNDFSTYVAVNRDIAEQALRKLSSGRVKGKSVKARLLDVNSSDEVF